MKDLKTQIDKIKKNLSELAQEDQKIRKVFKKVLVETFPDLNNPLRYVKDYSFKNAKIFITTTNKSFANELFLKKEEMILKIEKDGEGLIKELIVK